MDAASVTALLARRGEAATLRTSTATRAAMGGRITQGVTNSPVSVVVTKDEADYQDTAPKRTLELLLGGAVPVAGNTLVLRGVEHSITTVETFGKGGTAIVYKVTLS